MTNLHRSSRRGSALVEFAFVGVPMVLITVSVVSTSLQMWQFENLSYATETTARYVTTHGADCSCGITVGNVATFFANQGLWLSAGQITLTLTDNSGTTTCSAPFTSCESTGSAFPAAGANTPGNDITIKATYSVANPMAMFWHGNSATNLGATSTQRIEF